MKTLLIIFTLFITSIVFTQNITNTLGTNGLFTIKNSTTTFFSLSQSTGYIDLLASLNMAKTIDSNSGVIKKGGLRFLHNYGAVNSGNIFLGILSGNFTTGGAFPEGCYNTGIGSSTLSAISIGHSNTAIGFQSLYRNTTGSSNTALGMNSLFLTQQEITILLLAHRPYCKTLRVTIILQWVFKLC